MQINSAQTLRKPILERHFQIPGANSYILMQDFFFYFLVNTSNGNSVLLVFPR